MNMRNIRQILVVFLCLAIPMSGLAEFDLSSMSYEDLLSLQKHVSQELRIKEPVNGNLIYDKGGISIYYMGNNGIRHITEFQFQIVNASDKNIQVVFENVSVNDFSVNRIGGSMVSKGKKAICALSVDDLESYGITTMETIELSLNIIEHLTSMTLEMSDPIIIIP